MVECGGLENRYTFVVSRVRIPVSPQPSGAIENLEKETCRKDPIKRSKPIAWGVF